MRILHLFVFVAVMEAPLLDSLVSWAVCWSWTVEVARRGTVAAGIALVSDVSKHAGCNMYEGQNGLPADLCLCESYF